MTPYLLRRRDVFHFRRAVPDRLSRRLRRREFKLPLRTSDPATARRRSRVLANAIEALFEHVTAMPYLTAGQVDELIRGYFKAEWASINAALPALKQKGFEERDNSAFAADMAIENLRRRLEWDEFGADTLAKVREVLGYLPSEISPLLRQAARGLLRAEIDLARIYTAQTVGAYTLRLVRTPSFAIHGRASCTYKIQKG